MSRDARGLIRQAMEMLPTWKRQERRDTVITARRNGLTVAEAAKAAGCSVRHAKRLLQLEGLYLGRADRLVPKPPAPPAPPPCYASRHRAHLDAGVAECYPPEPTVTSPPPLPEPAPPRPEPSAMERVQDQYEAYRRERDEERQPAPTESAWSSLPYGDAMELAYRASLRAPVGTIVQVVSIGGGYGEVEPPAPRSEFSEERMEWSRRRGGF